MEISSSSGAVLSAPSIEVFTSKRVRSGNGRAEHPTAGESSGISLASDVFWRRFLDNTSCLSSNESAGAAVRFKGSFRGGERNDPTERC